LSFCLGIGLFGSVYLMPVFLAFVRRHDAFEIGSIMLVTGLAQLLAAPFAAILERRLGARFLTGVGFALFALGLGWSAFQPRVADFDEMFWPQVVRGVAIMFCLLPPTRIALGELPEDEVADASGLFNLMRNLGGAIGIALIDTIVYTRSGPLGDGLWERLKAGDVNAAAFVGAPLQAIAGHKGEFDADTTSMLDPLVQTAASVQAINEAWMVVAVLTACALLWVPFAKKVAATAG